MRADHLGHLGEQRGQLVVALDGDRRAVEVGHGPLGVRERDQRVERPDLGPGGLRRQQDVGVERSARVDHGLAAVQAQTRGQRGDGVVRDGDDDQLDLLDEGLRLGERTGPADERAEVLAPARVTARHRLDRPAGPGEGDAQRGPDRTRADDPDDRRLARLRVVVGMLVVARLASSSSWRWKPGGTGSRSMPAASMAASVSSRSRFGSPPRRVAPSPSSAGARVSGAVAVRLHPSSVASE